MNLTDCTETLKLVYDRGPDGYGVPVPGNRFKGTSKLLHVLMDVRQDFKTIGWWDHIESMLTAGLYVDKKGAHKRGIAWDFDGVVLKGNSLIWNEKVRQVLVYKKGVDDAKISDDVPYIIDSLPDRIRTRTACLFSLRFGKVLTAGYNKAHEDHIHCDLSRTVKWRISKSQVVLLQETLSAWFDAGLLVDGKYGAKTDTAWGKACYTMRSTSMDWLEWLKMIVFNPPKDGA